MKLRIPDYVCLFTDKREEHYNSDLKSTLCADGTEVSFKQEGNKLAVCLTSLEKGVRYLQLRWNNKMRKDVKVLGDAYERGYGDLQWDTIRPERTMPWYMAVSNGSDSCLDYEGRLTECFGVMVQPNAMCFWQYDTAGVTLWLDIRNGGNPTYLGGRVLECATVIFSEYENVSAYKAVEAFCGEMSPAPYLPEHKVYGSNNWYYAYGKSSHEEIIEDTKLVAKMCEGLPNIPYMVIDDGWQPNSVDAPWHIGNERFPDMKGLADKMRELGVRPGIWVRYLINGRDNTERKIEKPEEWYLERHNKVFDPSREDVLEYVAETTRRLTKEWGYELIKHDFSTFDIFGWWGFEMRDKITWDNWGFYDKTKTSAEIVKNFYKTIKENSNGAVIIGCNCIGHLCAGLHQLNRTGDDTSGFEWSRTAKMGVNTLAFRNTQNGKLFMSDADCVGITGAISWEQNREWLYALSRSGSPLFVSCKPGVLNEDELKELKEAYRVASYQADELIPLDWMETTTPERYLLNGKEVTFNWYTKQGNAWFADTIK